ncbi:MAG: FHA domain-containing protein [Symploca sp. SIO2G7]|nr:FHA domain-containing protein [Symploca sp. SIO2G7]
MNHYLQIKNNQIALPENGIFLIGRDDDCDLVLSDNRISRIHACINVVNECEVYIIDGDCINRPSRLGVFINNVKLSLFSGSELKKSTLLKDKDKIKIGNDVLSYNAVTACNFTSASSEDDTITPNYG